MSIDVAPAAPEIRHLTHFVPETVEFIVAQFRAAVAERGLFRLALSGGNTPRPIHELLATHQDLPWERLQITFGDERCVAPDDSASNFLMAKESLLSRAPIPEGNIFRLKGELPPAEAAAEYEQRLAQVARRFGEERYRHDLVLLGMGEDGHTASLFPGQPSLEEQEGNVIPAVGPKPPPQRLTMTFPLLNAARQVAFLVTPKGKEEVLQEVLAGEQKYPAARVRPKRGRVTWLIAGR